MSQRAVIYTWFRGEQDPDPLDTLDAQEERCRAYAEAQGYDVVEVLRESTSDEPNDRPELKRLRSMVWGRRADVVIAIRPGRLYLDPNRLTRLAHEARNSGVRLEFLEQPFVLQED